MSENETETTSSPDLVKSNSEEAEEKKVTEDVLEKTVDNQESSVEEQSEVVEEAHEEEEQPPTMEEVQTDLMEKVAEVERLKTALIAGDKDIKELQGRLRTVSTAYKKEKEDQEDFKQRVHAA